MKIEIKFRAWDKETNKYFEPTYQSYMGRIEELTITLSGRLQKRTCRGVADESTFHGRYVVEQYTGLKDANGKEIYEGDVVKYTAEDGDSFLAPVKYFAADGYPAFDIPTAFIPYWHFESNVLSAGMAENSIEVVGNIHDSPELLEADK